MSIYKFAFSVAIATLGIAPTYAARFSKELSDTGNLHSQTRRIAQVFRSTFSIPSGQTIVTRPIGEETIYVNSGQRLPAKLRVEQDVIGNNGIVVIPVGATIEGEFAPTNGGSKFIARTLTSRGATVAISAESDVIKDTKDPRETSIGAIATDVAIGAAGASILAAVTGDRAIATEEILAGAAAGGIIGNTTAPNATVIDPKAAISLTTSRSLTFTRGGD
ncbi:MAG: hypothetical protein HC770_04335 [Pseudanabaena sp. CRU_2_10]|nr:hypothetical protein [Pseudanabaena sp. CRU_2_10]